MLERADELAGFQQGIVRAGVEPGVAAAHLLDVEVAGLQVDAVQVGDLELAARARFQVARELDDAVVVEVEPGDRVVGLGLRGLLLQADRSAALAELDHAVALGVLDLVGEDRRAAFTRDRALQQVGQMRAEEDVVAQDQRDVVVADEVRADRERLC